VPEITGVKERRGRARISVDGEPWAELDAGVAIERGLREGAAFSWEELAEARAAGERPLAMTRALNLLGYRARSEGEVRERLGRHGYAPETVEAVIGRLRELAYLDDEAFARQRAQEKARKYGPRRVSADLMRSGVERKLASEAVAEEFEGRSELEDARSAVARRYNGKGSEAEARRVYGFLARRGYSAGVCAEVAKEHRGPAQSQ
jgi:regulatory protein